MGITEDSINAMRLNNYPLLHKTIQILQARQIEAHLVGGAVRDLLLGREKIVDFDFVTPNDGLKTARRVADALGAAFYPLDEERDTGRVVYQYMPGAAPTYLDFASFRGTTLEEDLADRDFTINAMALSLAGELIDPLNGRQDLQARQIRAASPEAFHQDPLRMLRAVRQAVEFDFGIDAETEGYLRQAIPRLSQVSPERQRDELLKVLNTPAPGEAIRWLQRLGVLARLLPEVEAMVGVSQSAPHYLDVFQHTAATLDAWAGMWQKTGFGLPEPLPGQVSKLLEQGLTGNLAQSMLVPLALLLHDTGKPQTRREAHEAGQLRVRFLGHEREGAKITRRVMRRWHFSSQAANFVEAVVAHHMRPLSLASSDEPISRRAIFRFFRDTTGPAGVAVALHALADHYGTYPPGEGQQAEHALRLVINRLLAAYFEQHEEIVDPPPLLTGHEVMEALGLAQGRLVGDLLRRLKEAQATGQVTTREAALAFIKADPDFAASQGKEL